MKLRARIARITPKAAAQAFAVSNIAFLGVDIALAHMANDFARPVEWAPIVFSAVATLLLLPGALAVRHRVVRSLELVAGWGAIVVGVVGMVFHLQSGFFAELTLHHLVYAAPFVAPLSYVGVGLLVLLLASKERDDAAFGSWVLLLALGGFIGNLALSLLDHAQNSFFRVTEWIPVASAAYAVAFLAVTLAWPRTMPVRVCAAVLGVQVIVGLTGFVLHGLADLHRSGVSLREQFVFGAPAFAPLLFADLALLAAIGLWASSTSAVPPEKAASL